MADILKAICLVIVGAVVGYFASTMTGEHKAAGVYNTAFELGPNGTVLGQIQKGSCSLIAGNYSVTASTTIAMDCAVPGVIPGDTVFAGLGTTAAAGAGWEIIGASASTTAGYVTFRIANGTGATAVIPAALASSTPYLTLR